MTRAACGGEGGGAWRDNPSSEWQELRGVCECGAFWDLDEDGRPEFNTVTSFTPTTEEDCEEYAAKEGFKKK